MSAVEVAWKRRIGLCRWQASLGPSSMRVGNIVTSILAACIAFTCTANPSVADERTFTFEERMYRFSFPNKLVFRNKEYKDGNWSAVFTTQPDENDIFIAFLQSSETISAFSKGYEDIWATATKAELDAIVKEVEEEYYSIDVPDYDGSRGMYIAGVRSLCPSECVIGFQIMYRHNTIGPDRKLLMELRAQLKARRFGPFRK